MSKEIVADGLIADSIVMKAKKQAQEILAQANKQSSEMILQAQTEAQNSKDEITAEARRQGYEEGYAEGQEKITSELQEIIENVNNFAKCEFETKHRITNSIHTDILDLVDNIS